MTTAAQRPRAKGCAVEWSLAGNVAECVKRKRRNHAGNTKVLWRAPALAPTIKLMRDDSAAGNTDRDSTRPLPPWSECDFFCIHDYASTGAAPCGWRGRLDATRQDDIG